MAASSTPANLNSFSEEQQIAGAKKIYDHLNSIQTPEDAENVLNHLKGEDEFHQYIGSLVEDLQSTAFGHSEDLPALFSANLAMPENLSANLNPPEDAKTAMIADAGASLQWANASDSVDAVNENRKVYVPQTNKNAKGYPPHVKDVPESDQDNNIFNKVQGVKVALAVVLLKSGLPVLFFNEGDLPNGMTDDEYFVEQRKAGVNPLPLRLLGNVEAGDQAIRQKFTDAGKPLPLPSDATLYVSDYSWMAPITAELFQSEQYVPAPICVLQYHQADGVESMTGFSILLDVSHRFKPEVVQKSLDSSALWSFAKQCVRAADWSAHELGSHLCESHLVTEVAALATYRTLPKSHPIAQLLLPHFFRTLPLNANARAKLVPDLIAKMVVPLDTDQANRVIAAVYSKLWNFKGRYVPTDLKNRGVDNFTPDFYPFGATALTAWNNIHNYVSGFLTNVQDAIGATNNLLDDYYVIEWIALMEKLMTRFERPTTLEELKDALTMVIYVSSHQHSAVNYFQERFLSYVPGNPSELRLGFKGFKDMTDVTDDEVKKMTPTTQQQNLIQNVVKLLSDKPTTDHTLVAFKYDGSAYLSKWLTAHYQKCDLLDPTTFQNDLDRELKLLNASPTTAIIRPPILAQSVLI